jgi:hypothetical protein
MQGATGMELGDRRRRARSSRDVWGCKENGWYAVVTRAGLARGLRRMIALALILNGQQDECCTWCNAAVASWWDPPEVYLARFESRMRLAHTD